MRSSPRRGSAIVEFALVAFLLVTVVLAGFEFTRMALVYTTLANAAKTGVRYAIVHGADRTGTGDPPSGPTDNPAAVVTVIKNFASLGVLNLSSLASDCSSWTVPYASTSPGCICVTYPNATNNTGSTVTVRIRYRYDPFVGLPIRAHLRATAQGIIVF